MDLGKAKLPRTGLNVLLQAVHPLHGIAWTDGRQVYLTSILSTKGEVVFGHSNVVGHFEHVQGLYWGPVCCSCAPALLAVQQKKHVSIWELRLSSLQQNQLLCSQMCEASEPLPLLPQGCIWHPRMDLLAVMTKRDASVLFSVRVDNRRVRAKVTADGVIHCGCWTKDGTRLVLAIGEELHSFIWNDVRKELVVCSFCPVFEVGSPICAVAHTENCQIAVTTGFTLEHVGNAVHSLDVLSSRNGQKFQSSANALEDCLLLKSRRKSIDSEGSLAIEYISSSGPMDLTNILAKHRNSDPSPLIHSSQRDSSKDLFHLKLVTFSQKVTTTKKVNIHGILVPDILAFDSHSCSIAVASNICQTVLVYGVTSSSLVTIQQLQMEETERLKGLCFLADRLLLTIAKKSNEPVFLRSSNMDKYHIRLETRKLNYTDTKSASTILEENTSCPENKTRAKLSECKKLISFVGRESHFQQDSKLLTEELTQRSCIRDGNLEPDLMSLDVSEKIVGTANKASSPRLNLEVKEISESLAETLDRLFTRFTQLQRCLTETMDSKNYANKIFYPPLPEAPFVNVTYQNELAENVFVDEKKAVLLCEGKLCLRAVQELFSLTVVEMRHGSLWVVLAEDSDGFVPLNFSPKSNLTIRNGKHSLTGERSGCIINSSDEDEDTLTGSLKMA
ncbi:WD repeat and coiled-coil-containing protein-like [Chanos chanos]|uniref:WD repeat and coiled-coil-containing protein n=1 Tax=Chanos chanos TaxID=29144 RepID=A0A6J2VCV5_CHACN|nr:WD repeat and coiled-coil-containing protein-like [Chanos chanos]